MHREEYFSRIKKGEVFIYPTDTIYGVGCDATNDKAVQKIRNIKESFDNPFSIIAPSKEWIMSHCEVFGKGKDYLDKLPGKFTLIFELKHPESIAENVNPKGESVGIRIPRHWFAEEVEAFGIPIVTTSVNRHGESFLMNISELPHEIKSRIDFCIDEGKIEGKPSQLVDLRSGEAIVKR